MRPCAALSAMQVLQLYVVPQIGPAQVLKAQHKPPPTPLHSPQHTQQPPGTLLDSYPAPAAAAGAEDTAGAAAAAELAPATTEGARPDQPPGRAASSSSASQQGDADDALLLNIAERDLAEVAQAIAAAAGSNLDAELASLLAGATMGMRDLEALDFTVGQAAATPGAAALADTSITSTEQQQQLQLQQEGLGSPAEASATGADIATAGGDDAGAAASDAFRLPQTLPGVRSWRARLGAMGGSEGEGCLPVHLWLCAHFASCALDVRLLQWPG